MAFVHGKNSVFMLRDAINTWRDMTPYVSEVTLPGKAGIAETTVFGRGAKTYIGGLLEGQLTMKGFFDPTATFGPDAVLSGLLGTQPSVGLTAVAQVTTTSNYGQFLLFPAGIGTAASSALPVLLGDIVLTDYSISDPVSNVVSYTATFQLSGAPNIVSGVITGAGTYATGGANNTGNTGLQVIRNTTANVLVVGWQATGGVGQSQTGVTYASTSSGLATNLGTR